MGSNTKASYICLATNFENQRMAKETPGGCKWKKKKAGSAILTLRWGQGEKHYSAEDWHAIQSENTCFIHLYAPNSTVSEQS